MQISRHWRMNSQRYRLEGVRYHNGEVSLQSRPTFPSKTHHRSIEGAPVIIAEPEPVSEEVFSLIVTLYRMMYVYHHP